MDYTDAEFNYLKYLLQQLNFTDYDESFTLDYLKKLKAAVFRFKKIGDCDKKEIEFHGEKRYIPANGLRTIHYVENEENFEVLSLSIFQYLQLEINIKKKRLYKYNYISREKISATDISNFTFCPANFAISKTFSYKALEETVQGTEFHEKNILRYLFNRVYRQAPKNLRKEKNKFSDFSSVRSDEAFIELRKTVENRKILYSGHIKDSKIFQSLKGNYAGNPDYILQEKNSGEIFVVEEKFRFQNNDNEVEVFHQNHLNQILSYIYGIHEPRISFGNPGVLGVWDR